MEPYWNNALIKQVIGRAQRRDSHADLPENERNVSVYRFLSVIDKADRAMIREKDRISTDEVVLEIAKKKEKLTNAIMDCMKESAVDCVLNYHDNNENIKCLTFDKSNEAAYSPMIKYDLGRSVENETKNVKVELRVGVVDTTGEVYFMENKKLYKITDTGKKNPLNKIPKIKAKVAIDVITGKLYDFDAATKTGVKIPYTT